MDEIITSRQNPKVKLLEALLTQKKARMTHGLFVLEGRNLLLDAHQAGLVPTMIFVSARALIWYGIIPDELRFATAQMVLLSDDLADRIAATHSPQGVFGVYPIPEKTPLLPDPAGRYLLLHEVRDPGNLGSILRTAAALGVSGVVLSHCAELWAPKVLRASMGGVWRVPIFFAEMEDAIKALQDSGVTVFAAALQEGAKEPSALTGRGRAVLIGNEGAGLPKALIQAAGQVVMIPMHGESESLGAAMAAGILMWEMLRS